MTIGKTFGKLKSKDFEELIQIEIDMSKGLKKVAIESIFRLEKYFARLNFSGKELGERFEAQFPLLKFRGFKGIAEMDCVIIFYTIIG